jgi:hypothetical protein
LARCPRRVSLDQNLDGRLGRAALAHELDGPVQVGFAAGQPLGEREGIPGFHEHVQAPAFDLRLVAAVRLDDLCRLSHDLIRSPSHRRTLPRFVGWEAVSQTALGTRERLIYALCQLSEPGVEDCSLGLCVGPKRLQAPAQLLLGL